MQVFKFLIIFIFSLSALSFETKTVLIDGKVLKVEVAQTEEEHERGLMGRKSLANGHGMLFIFREERILSFWMKNTLIPLSIGFFDSQKKLINIHDMEPASPMDLSPKTYESTAEAKYAIEVPKGWFKKNKIKPGAVFKINSGPKPKRSHQRERTEPQGQYKEQ
ncbi:MAG: DUF192 domain-containing protein [Oligoflexia bacterium]|nr:DUF192 domain-containing protein [Oligoflexia bacterium]